MTRARHELVMLVPEKSRGLGTYAGVLRSGLNSAGQSPGILYQNGNANWDDESKAEKHESSSIVWNVLAAKTLPRNLPRATPSGMELKTAHRSGEAKASVLRHDASLRGTAMHACFASVQWLDLAAPNLAGTPALNATALQKVVKQSVAGKQGNIDYAEIVNEFLAICQQSEVRKIFMRSSYPAAEDVTVETERRFSVHWQEKLLHGSMDRLVIRRLDGVVMGLEIIDFKTDRPLEGELESEFLMERRRIYAPQLEAYRQATAKLYPQVRNVSVKIVFTSVNRVIDV
jgi:ATP-dependent exoDNAse (exonuclease V) beta subunit